MELQKGKTELFLTWHEAYSKARDCQKSFGLKLWQRLFTCQIDLQQKVCGERHRKKHGVEENQAFPI